MLNHQAFILEKPVGSSCAEQVICWGDDTQKWFWSHGLVRFQYSRIKHKIASFLLKSGLLNKVWHCLWLQHTLCTYVYGAVVN